MSIPGRDLSHPASRTERSRLRLQGVISFHELAMPIWGLSQSASPIPTARSIPREVRASIPSVTVRERGLMSGLAGVSGMLQSVELPGAALLPTTHARPDRSHGDLSANGLRPNADATRASDLREIGWT